MKPVLFPTQTRPETVLRHLIAECEKTKIYRNLVEKQRSTNFTKVVDASIDYLARRAKP